MSNYFNREGVTELVEDRVAHDSIFTMISLGGRGSENTQMSETIFRQRACAIASFHVHAL